MRPRRPTWRSWRRYMPVMPARASAAIRTLAESRDAHSVVAIEAASGGWPIWTAMKMAPATALRPPAALVRPVVVTS